MKVIHPRLATSPLFLGGRNMLKIVKPKCLSHYWLLGQPSDGVVHGRCQKCLKERDFPAYHPQDSETELRKQRSASKKELNFVQPPPSKMGRPRNPEIESRRGEILAMYKRLGNVRVTARAIGMPRGTLYKKLEQWGIKKKGGER